MKYQATIVKKEKNATALAQVVAVHSDLKPGLTLMVGPINDGQALLCQAMMVKALVHASSCLPVPTPERDNIFFIDSGPARQLEQLSATRAKLGLTTSELKKFEVLKRVTSSVLDWTSPAAVSILLNLKALKSGGYVFLMQPLGTEPDTRGLLQLNRMAEEHDTRVIMFCPGVVDSDKYSSVANEVFMITPRDPNPGYEQAFEVSCTQLTSSLDPASGKVLCCVRMGDDGLESEITPYVADGLKMRLMAILKADGWSLEKIGEIVKLNKSNVSRKLCFVSTTVPEGWNTAMLNEWLEVCGFDPVEYDDASVEDSDCDDQTAESEDYDDKDDLDDLDCIKPVAKASRNERNKRNEIKPKKKQR